jgi:hypothetical protein
MVRICAVMNRVLSTCAEHEQANAETQKLLNRAKGQLSMLKNKRKRKMDLEIKLNQLKVFI